MLSNTTKKNLDDLGLLECEDSYQLEHLFNSLSDIVLARLNISRENNKYKCRYRFIAAEQSRTISEDESLHEAISKATITLKNLDII
jgi:hypothetical protein